MPARPGAVTAVYRVDPRNNAGAVKLEAARQYKWDLQLAEFNNAPPNVRTIQASTSGSTNP